MSPLNKPRDVTAPGQSEVRVFTCMLRTEDMVRRVKNHEGIALYSNSNLMQRCKELQKRSPKLIHHTMLKLGTHNPAIAGQDYLSFDPRQIGT